MIVGDEQAINSLIRSPPTAECCCCDCVFDGRRGVDRIEQNRYDLVLGS